MPKVIPAASDRGLEEIFLVYAVAHSSEEPSSCGFIFAKNNFTILLTHINSFPNSFFLAQPDAFIEAVD